METEKASMPAQFGWDLASPRHRRGAAKSDFELESHGCIEHD